MARFLTAQYKEHTQKITRRTYLIPPPSAVAGIFGAIIGVKREKLIDVSEDIWAGAELKSSEGRITTLARVFKIDRPASKLLDLVKEYYYGERGKVIKDVQGLLTIKESEELYMPEYKFAIASSNDILIDEGLRRLREYDFEYEVFGGNDYNLPEFIGDPKPAKVEKSREGCGYCPHEDLDRVEAESFNVAFNVDALEWMKPPIIVPVMFLANVNMEFVQVYRAKIITKKELNVVNDGEDKIFVYKVKPFLVMQI
jgi:CRISPR-associated Cas5-like protein